MKEARIESVTVSRRTFALELAELLWKQEEEGA